MILMNLSKIKKAFGTDVLFDDVSFSIDEHDKIGFVGANGTGKTTLLKIMLGDLSDDGGEIFKNNRTAIGYMQQQTNLTSEKTVLDELMTVFEHLMQMERDLEQLSHDIESGNGDALDLAKKQYALQERYEQEGGFTYKSVAKASLLGLGFNENELYMDFNSLSGGQKTRVFLCKILLSQANLLFLDEPTNHLDIQSVEWLEGFLRDYKGAFVVISHDRYFLDKVANKIFELENGRLTVYNGNYSEYIRQKEENRKAQERKFENTQKEIARLEGIVEQQRRWNREKNIKTAESKLKMIDRLEQTLDRPDDLPEGMRFSFPVNRRGGNDVIECSDLSMRFGTKELFKNAALHITHTERVFLLGPNGCGKTTLFKLIMNELEPLGGTVKLGTNIDIGYYDQTQDHLDYTKTVFAEVADAYPKMTQTQVRCALAAFLFRGDDVFKLISELSGGERAKVSLLKLMLSGSNLLLLDEPTNHLDIASREALEDALMSYEGTLFVVSHDRYFINKLAHRVVYMTTDGLLNYLGDYDYYIEKRKTENVQVVTEQKSQSGKQDYLMQKQKDAEERKRLNRIKKIEEQIAHTEEEIEKLTAELESDECATNYVKAAEITDKINELSEQLMQMYEEWDTLQ
ncbi:MAG: ABC-F family ATP-binding cassette domain-containing protein [Clostridia bacterium]|nr:ABC-F family ATP-binding cassette domain-containing protein [Clostridia bacterium]